MDGWFQGCTGGGHGAPDAYRQLLNGFMCSYAPGLQYKEEQAVIIPQVLQQQLHQISMQMNEEEAYIPGDRLAQSMMEDLVPLHHRSLPSSSSSSLRSLPASSSCHPEVTTEIPLAPLAYDQCTNLQFPTPAIDTAAMEGAVFSTTASPSLSPPLIYQNTQEQAHRCRNDRAVAGAFKPYVRHLSPKKKPKVGVCGQRMNKMAISLLTRMYMMRFENPMSTEARPSGNQLQHMISERKRREKLNESFRALKMVLPPGSKKDKTSILVRAKDYVNTLKAKTSELEEKNRMLESKLRHNADRKEDDDSGEKIEIQINQATECTLEFQEIHLKIVLGSKCNTTDVVLRILQCLKEMGNFSLVTMNTSSGLPRGNTSPQASLTLQLKSSKWDDELLKESVTKVIEDVVSQSEMVPP